MAHGYEAWRISFQSSEQAAKAAWHNWQREIDDLHQKLDKQEGRAELAEAKAAEAEALIEKLASAIRLINPSMDFAGWESGDGEPIGDLLNEAVSAYTAWKDQP